LDKVSLNSGDKTFPIFLHYCVRKNCHIYFKIALRKASDQTVVILNPSDARGTCGPGIHLHSMQPNIFMDAVDKLFILFCPKSNTAVQCLSDSLCPCHILLSSDKHLREIITMTS
jgi:hypothetical protein